MKVIVITGSTRGIGYALAKFFLEQHWAVVINGRTDASVSRALKSLGAFGKSDMLIGVPGDVSVYDTHTDIIAKANDTFGKIDIWINNAGIDQDDEWFFEHDNNSLKTLVGVNVTGMILGTKAAYNTMCESGGGYIYNMEGFGSDGRKMSKLTLYGTTKRALRYATIAMANEINTTDVKIGRLSPGMVATDFLKVTLIKGDAEAERRKKIYNILADTPETVANYLGDRILKNKKNNVLISWLTTPKIIMRFLLAPFSKRRLFDE